MLRTFTSSFIILGSIMHIFCCGLPLLLSFTSLATVFGISSLTIFEIEWFEAVEGYVLIISGVMLLMTFIIDRYSKQLDCSENEFCTHPPCGEKKNTYSYILRIAIILYFINIITVVLNTLNA